MTQDEKLREKGFTIARRPKGGSPVWQRGGRYYPEELAIKLAEGDEACPADESKGPEKKRRTNLKGGL